jgi:hypothetical protein
MTTLMRIGCWKDQLAAQYTADLDYSCVCVCVCINADNDNCHSLTILSNWIGGVMVSMLISNAVDPGQVKPKVMQ